MAREALGLPAGRPVSGAGGAGGALLVSSEPVELALIVAYRLPLPLVMTGRCLGLRVEAAFGGADVEIRIPHDQSPNDTLDEDDFSLMRRTGDGASGSTVAPSETVTDAWRDFNEPDINGNAPERSVEVHRLLIGVSTLTARLPAPRFGVGHSTEARLQDELYAQADAWHDVFRTWIEVATAQDLDHVQRRWSAHIEGSTMATFTSAGVRNVSGGRVRLDNYDETPAPPRLVRHAFLRAGRLEYPPLAHVLLRDGRAAYWRRQMRRAVLDAATSSELSLHALVELHHVNVRRPTLGPLLKSVRDAQLIGDELASDLSKWVIRPRNAAIHQGREPDGWHTADGLRAAQVLALQALPLT